MNKTKDKRTIARRDLSGNVEIGRSMNVVPSDFLLIQIYVQFCKPK